MPVFSLFSLLFKIIVQNPIIFSCFQPILTFFPPDLSMKYRIFISIVDISANLKNIDIDKEILENIDIDRISNRLEFGISNSPTYTWYQLRSTYQCLCNWNLWAARKCKQSTKMHSGENASCPPTVHYLHSTCAAFDCEDWRILFRLKISTKYNYEDIFVSKYQPNMNNEISMWIQISIIL